MKLTSRNSILHAYLRPVWIFLFLFLCGATFKATASNYSERDELNAIQESVKITGTIVDETNEPIPGVSIIIKGTTTGTVTDLNGSFNLEVPLNSVLMVSYIGFGSQEITISGDQTEFRIVLLEETENLEEVVVVGYGVQKKETVTGSLSTVSADELVEQPVSNISQALGGRLPGLISNQAGGRPGKDASTIKIRGIGTLDAGAGSNPLIMIDGIEREQADLNFLDPNEIESISILKDASSTAVYGVRGANGVILVTTKRGKVGPAIMKYKSSMAIMIPDFTIDFIDSYQQAGLLNEYQGFTESTDNPIAPYPNSIRNRFKGVIDGNPLNPNDPFFYPSTDYSDLLLKDYAIQHQHNLTISGGTERVKYFSSLGYFNQGGMFEPIAPESDKTTNYQRYNYRTNIDIKISNTTDAAINVGGSFNKNVALGLAGREPANSFYWSSQVHSSPWEGYMYDGKLVMLQENGNSVLLNSDIRGYNVELENTADYSFKLNQKLDFITEGLSVKGTASFVSYFRNFIDRGKDQRYLAYYYPVVGDDGKLDLLKFKEDTQRFNSNGQSKTRKQYYELAFNYNHTFADTHTVTGLVLGNAEKSFFTQNEYNAIPRAYLGLVGRVTYNYMNKYFAEYNLGYNGSENFAEGQRFGFFPAYSAGWTFTEEPWLQTVIGNNILSYGKFRFSYGTVGNDRMRGARFLYLPDSYFMNVHGDGSWYNNYRISFGLPEDRSIYLIAIPGQAGNPNVTWEKSTKINYGADLSFFDDLVSVKFDYFTEDRTDILINQNVVPVYQQTGDLALNLGEVENKGYEIEIGLNKKISKNLRVWADVNYTHAKNKIIEVDEPKQPFDYQQRTGRSVGELYGYQQGEIFMTAEAADAYKEELWQSYSALNPGANRNNYQAYQIFAAGSDVSAGDLKFIDRNGDGLINDMDQGYLGTPSFPETMYALKGGFELKSWTFSFMLQGATDFAINARTTNSPTPAKGSILDFVLNRYTPERYDAGEKIEFPRLLATNNNWEPVGTFWLRDATYLRLKSVEIGYTFEKDRRLIKSLGLDNFRIFANGLNLLTWSDIKYIDPETTNGELRYPRSRVINLGIQAQF